MNRPTPRPPDVAPHLTRARLMALTLYQPWATLIALGAKRIETRAWSCPEACLDRWIAIHASTRGRSAANLHRLLDREPFRSVLAAHDITAGTETDATLPRGAVVALAHLVACVPTERVRWRLTASERAFGDYRPGRFAWSFDQVVRLSRPVRVRGARWLWTLPPDIETAVLEQGDPRHAPSHPPVA